MNFYYNLYFPRSLQNCLLTQVRASGKEVLQMYFFFLVMQNANTDISRVNGYVYLL